MVFFVTCLVGKVGLNSTADVRLARLRRGGACGDARSNAHESISLDEADVRILAEIPDRCLGSRLVRELEQKRQVRDLVDHTSPLGEGEGRSLSLVRPVVEAHQQLPGHIVTTRLQMRRIDSVPHLREAPGLGRGGWLGMGLGLTPRGRDCCTH